jgi:uncharacterized membrane protein YkoI
MKTIILYLSFTLLLMTSAAALSAQEEISKQQAMDIATKSNPGRVLSVKRSADTYKVKTLSENGEVRIIVIDARSGKVLSGK